MDLSFESKVALVTGASSGIGLARVKASAEANASVVLAVRQCRRVRSGKQTQPRYELPVVAQFEFHGRKAVIRSCRLNDAVAP
jgi:NAD(P)-dependent dehydrogenase (short-subunit alcohol dehydrogenase family)